MSMQRLLDLDLDFFLDDVEYFSGGTRRLSDDDFHPWEAVRVQRFLEDRCGLSRDGRIPGRVVTHHYEAFLWWRDLVEVGTLVPPFEVVHVDAHADLGCGDASWSSIMGELLHRPVAERTYPEEGGFTGLNAGNYLAFAAACRWLSKVTYVRNLKSNDDLQYLLFKNNDPQSGLLQLRKCAPESLKDFLRIQYGSFDVIELEPEIPFSVVSPENFLASGPFAFAVLSQSPSFTPLSSDGLIPVIADYFRRA
jgi:hypothetical protein